MFRAKVFWDKVVGAKVFEDKVFGDKVFGAKVFEDKVFGAKVFEDKVFLKNTGLGDQLLLKIFFLNFDL